MAPGPGPLVVPLGQEGADQTDDRGAVGEDADDGGAAAELLVEHRHQGPLGSAPGLDQPVGEVAAGPQLPDGQFDRAHPGVEVPALSRRGPWTTASCSM